MSYSYFIGLFTNLSLDFMPWVFLVVVVLLGLIGISSLLTLSEHNAKQKTLYVIAYFIVCLFVGGLVGIMVSIITHFMTYAFVSEFRKDYL